MRVGGARMLAVEGHSGGGPGSGCAVYRFTELPGTPTVAVLSPDGACEARALALAAEASDSSSRRAGLRAEPRSE